MLPSGISRARGPCGLDAGTSFVITRNGVAVGELVPLRPRAFAAAEAAVGAFAGAPPVQPRRFRRDVELAKHGNEGGVAMDAASNYAMAGDRAPALDWLERAHAERDPNMPFIGCNPVFDPLRAEPRFQALLRQMNLPQ